MESRPGTYLLVLRSESSGTLEIGKLGVLNLSRGWYLYAGSALGPGGVRARVLRHCRLCAHPHWHIDYLRAHVEIEAVLWRHGTRRRECEWAEVLKSTPGCTVPLSGFGSSDCQCETHLHFFRRRPGLESLLFACGAGQWRIHPPRRRP